MPKTIKKETLHNPDFNRVQFEAVKNEAGLNRFVMTPTKWIEQMNEKLYIGLGGDEYDFFRETTIDPQE